MPTDDKAWQMLLDELKEIKERIRRLESWPVRLLGVVGTGVVLPLIVSSLLYVLFGSKVTQ